MIRWKKGLVMKVLVKEFVFEGVKFSVETQYGIIKYKHLASPIFCVSQKWDGVLPKANGGKKAKETLDALNAIHFAEISDVIALDGCKTDTIEAQQVIEKYGFEVFVPNY
jgi:hypothetical protein